MPKTSIRYNTILMVKLSKREKERAQVFAELYAGGNLSKFVRHCLREFNPKMLNKKGRIKRPRQSEGNPT